MRSTSLVSCTGCAADWAAADAAYRQASRFGRPPEPGIALLWLARGQRMRRRPPSGEPCMRLAQIARSAPSCSRPTS